MLLKGVGGGIQCSARHKRVCEGSKRLCHRRSRLCLAPHCISPPIPSSAHASASRKLVALKKRVGTEK